MSILNVTEYERLGRDESGSPIPVGSEPAVTTQDVTFTTSSVASNAFNAKTRFVRVISDVDASIAFGESPTALTTSMRVIAGTPEYFGLNAKLTLKVAAITS